VTCFHPIKAYRSREKSPLTGGYGVTFNPLKSLVEGSSFSVPCGRCTGCRLTKSKDWAARCMHESQMHTDNCFLTLTFNDENLPSDYSVQVRTWQLFMKRLRKSTGSKKLRFFACGEYGDLDQRPHYHSLIFGYDFTDKKLHSKKNNIPLYTSESLQKIWPYGFSTIGRITYQSAAYTARYNLKKIGGPMAADYYTRVHPLSGNLVRVNPEFSVQSRRPGIGSTWFDAFKADLYPSDFIVVDRKKHAVPKYYTLKLKEVELKKIKRRRKASSNLRRADQTPARLKVREEVQLARAKLLKREL